MHSSIISLSLFLVFASGISPLLDEVSVSVNGGVEFVIVDPMGRQEGINPITKQRYREINNSYGEFSVDSEDPNIDPPEPINEFMTHNPVEGHYRLTLYGTKLARYRLFVTVFAHDKGQGMDSYGLIDSNQVRVLEFEYSSDSTAGFTVNKLISASNLREDLASCFRLKFLGNQSLYKELEVHVDHIERRLEKKDSSSAFAELEKLVKELKKAREETEKHEKRKRSPNRFVTLEAYQVLSDDISILMSSIGEHNRKDRGSEDKRR